MASNEESKYRALVVDSGPIIRLSSTAFRDRAESFYTVPAVLQEIRDSKARQHLEQLPFQLIQREASPEGIKAVVDFARQTGDYNSLSAVDLQILGLLYDLEREGCQGDVSHIRTTPKRTLGVGRIESLAKEGDALVEPDIEQEDMDEQAGAEFFETPVEPVPEKDEGAPPKQAGAKSWAMLVNPAAASPLQVEFETKVADRALKVRFGSMNLSGERVVEYNDQDLGGQFSDAEEDSMSSDDEGYADSDVEISDEECDVYILDPDEVEERKASMENELKSDFPSLSASLLVPCEESNEEDGIGSAPTLGPATLAKQEAERKKQEALRPVTKSGKLYNSFRKYGDVMKPKYTTIGITEEESSETQAPEVASNASPDEGLNDDQKEHQSRIIGGMTMSGQGMEVDDDGEGWITSPTDIRKMKAAGLLNPTHNPGDVNENASEKAQSGPPVSQRAACTTTDFAMQNVILQMNLELLSVDGIKVQRLKSWVTRCGACFTVFADGDNVGPVNTKRLFCARCGSDMLQRVAASVDGKTGRLRLHLSKKYKNNLRGTKFSLPKPGTVS